MTLAGKVLNLLIVSNILLLNPELESLINEWRIKYLNSPNISADIENKEKLNELNEMDDDDRFMRSIQIASKYHMIDMNKDHLLTLIDLSYQYEIDPDLVLAIIYTESRFDPNAKNKKSSATGYGQLIESTACSVAKQIPEIKEYEHKKDAYNPYINLHITIKYIDNCLNASGGDVKKALRRYRGVEDDKYFNKVLSFRNDIKKSKQTSFKRGI